MKKLLLILLCLIFTLNFGYSQNLVSTTPENRNIILEEFTGIYNVWCPDGHLIAQQLHDANPGDVVLIFIWLNILIKRLIMIYLDFKTID